MENKWIASKQKIADRKKDIAIALLCILVYAWARTIFSFPIAILYWEERLIVKAFIFLLGLLFGKMSMYPRNGFYGFLLFSPALLIACTAPVPEWWTIFVMLAAWFPCRAKRKMELELARELETGTLVRVESIPNTIRSSAGIYFPTQNTPKKSKKEKNKLQDIIMGVSCLIILPAVLYAAAISSNRGSEQLSTPSATTSQVSTSVPAPHPSGTSSCWDAGAGSYAACIGWRINDRKSLHVSYFPYQDLQDRADRELMSIGFLLDSGTINISQAQEDLKIYMASWDSEAERRTTAYNDAVVHHVRPDTPPPLPAYGRGSPLFRSGSAIPP